MKTINQFFNEFKDNNNNSNQALLNNHDLLLIIKIDNLWQKTDFYKTQKTFDFKTYSKMSFHSFIKEVFGATANKFAKMDEILSLDKGKELFLKYGLSNMKIYYNSTDEERKAVLDLVVSKKRLCSWSLIKKELYPSIKKEPVVSDAKWKTKHEKGKKKSAKIISSWKKKYEDEKKLRIEVENELNLLKEKVKDLFGEFKMAA